MQFKKIIFIFLVIVIGLFAIFSKRGYAVTIVAPGDTGSLILPVKNYVDSIANMDEVKIEVTAPSYFIIKGTSLRGPKTILPNDSYSFQIDYEISSIAIAGDFDVKLTLKTATQNCIPKPPDTSWDTLHQFKIGPAFELTAEPLFSVVERWGSVNHTITVRNNYIEEEGVEEEEFNLTANTSSLDVGWTITGLPLNEVFTLGAGEEKEFIVRVTNNNASTSLEIPVNVKCGEETRFTEIYDSYRDI
jgi:hypothetical protein